MNDCREQVNAAVFAVDKFIEYLDQGFSSKAAKHMVIREVQSRAGVRIIRLSDQENEEER